MAVSFGSDGPLLQLITQEHKRQRGQASKRCLQQQLRGFPWAGGNSAAAESININGERTKNRIALLASPRKEKISRSNLAATLRTVALHYEKATRILVNLNIYCVLKNINETITTKNDDDDDDDE